MASPLTIRDLAARLGVSRTTVSLALRNDLRIKEDTRTRIINAAADAGYQRSAMVSTLMTQVRARRVKFHGEVIGFMTAIEDEHYWRNQSEGVVYLGAHEMAEKLGFKLEPFWMGPLGSKSKQTARIMRSRGVRGMIIPYVPLGLEPLELDWVHMPVVATGYSFRQKAPHRVAANQFQTSALCYQRLRELGHKRIGIAMGMASDVRVNNYWISAFLGSQHRLGGALLEPLDIQGVPDRDVFMRWFDQQRPDVIIVALVKNQALKWLREAGIRVPEDVSVASLDVVEKDGGSIAGISQNHHLVGAGAILLLSNLIFRNEAGLPLHPTITISDVTWVDGATVKSRL